MVLVWAGKGCYVWGNVFQVLTTRVTSAFTFVGGTLASWTGLPPGLSLSYLRLSFKVSRRSSRCHAS